jgi:predicted ribosome quality control (RQC) complex YloA/Tae2 family protein
MLTNYFLLNRLCLELDKLISGWTIKEIFTQDKNILILSVENSNLIKYLELNVNHAAPYINIVDEFHRAKKNSINFFPQALKKEISSVSIAKFDRIIKLNMNNSSLYFAVRGKFTNVYFEHNDKISTFKKIGNDNYLKEFKYEMEKIEFTHKFNYPKFDNPVNPQNLKNQFPFLGKEIIQELNRRLAEKQKDIREILKSILYEISENKPSVFTDEKSLEVELAIETIGIYKYDKKINFNNLTDAINYYISRKNYFDNLNSLKKNLTKEFERNLSKLEFKVENLKKRIDRGSKEELYDQYGNLLLININKVTKGSKNIIVNNVYEENKEVSIKLDPSLNARQNVDQYFEKARDEKTSLKKSQQLLSDTANEINSLREKLNKLNSINEIQKLTENYKITNQTKSSKHEDLNEKFKHYVIENKYDVYVGKDSKSNDLLTLRFAKPNDYWFHAKNVPGSHAVLRVESTKENIPKYILEHAASIAAFHSKDKNAGVAPVAYTFKKYVIKRKGLEPGQVILLKENVLLVKPEIPKDAEFVKK